MPFEDFAGAEDVSIDETVTGAAAIGEAVGRRVTTKELWYDPGYACLDLGEWQSRAMTNADVYRLRVDVERCVRAERRVQTFTVDVAFYALGMELRVRIDGVTVDGDAFVVTATVTPDEGVVLAVAA
jgi:hypothetical protein